MTAQQSVEMFARRHGAEWLVFQRDPMYLDMMEMLRSHDPAREFQMATVDHCADPNITMALMNRSAQHNLLLNLLDHGVQLPGPSQQIEATYEEQNEDFNDDE
jgi:hypothetical protein